jgi:hypothetical protein
MGADMKNVSFRAAIVAVLLVVATVSLLTPNVQASDCKPDGPGKWTLIDTAYDRQARYVALGSSFTVTGEGETEDYTVTTTGEVCGDVTDYYTSTGVRRFRADVHEKQIALYATKQGAEKAVETACNPSPTLTYGVITAAPLALPTAQ